MKLGKGHILSAAARTWISLQQSWKHRSTEELKRSFTVQCNKVKAKRTTQVQETRYLRISKLVLPEHCTWPFQGAWNKDLNWLPRKRGRSGSHDLAPFSLAGLMFSRQIIFLPITRWYLPLHEEHTISDKRFCMFTTYLLSAQILRKHPVSFPGMSLSQGQSLLPRETPNWCFHSRPERSLGHKVAVWVLPMPIFLMWLKPYPSSASFALLFITVALVVSARCTAAPLSLLPKLTLKCLLGPDVFHMFHCLFSSPPPDPILKYPLINLSSLVLGQAKNKSLLFPPW